MPDHRAIRQRLEAARAGLDAAMDERDAAIIQAWKAGWNLRAIGEHVGLSYVTVGTRLDKLQVRHRPTYKELGRKPDFFGDD